MTCLVSTAAALLIPSHFNTKDKLGFKMARPFWPQCLMSIILTTQEVELRKVNPRQKHKTLSEK
jgi:hypothetical protein